MWDIETLAVINKRRQQAWLASRLCKTLQESGVRINEEVKVLVDELVKKFPDNEQVLVEVKKPAKEVARTIPADERALACS